MNLEKTLKAKAKLQAESTPRLFDLSKTGHRQNLKKLFAKKHIRQVVDDYREQLKEYYQILNPQIASLPIFEKNFQNYISGFEKNGSLMTHGRWVYFPWLETLVHILEEKNFFVVRTARNKNLITEAEQKIFYDAVIGVAGLSIGNSAALAITLQGGARHIKLADHDKLELSNTNRIRTSITNLSLLKVQVAARQIYELNPYAKVDIFSEGINEKNISGFCRDLNIIIDEVDNLAVKYLLREYAKKKGLPVVMAADNGDNGQVDIERYDINKKTKFFHGRLGKVSLTDLKSLNKFQTGRLIVKLLGVENIGQRTYESFLQMGNTLVSWPQLGGSALLNGSVVAYCVRKILNKQKLSASRTVISLDAILTPNFDSKEIISQRIKIVKKIKQILKLP
ncbi:MAG: ThiF family adenylyltransferase [Candidatus Doudnabacteria bacterium]|nr:ThiF family adenylyltransferase [Candidatus Doudnabacteria bacterium]